MSIRISVIQFIIDINEKIFFYPKLQSFYKNVAYPTSLTTPPPLKNHLTIFDVGANKGQSIDFFCKIFKNPTIYAFEPNPTLYKKLKEKYSIKKNIFIYNLGVSDINGQLELSETVTDETSTFEKLNYESNYLQMKANILGVKKEDIIKRKYFVDVIRLDDFINKMEIDKIHILKIDTEGHELKCLKGLFTNFASEIKYIQLESHNDDMYLKNATKDEIPDLLNINGYNKCTKIKHGFGDFNECIYEK
jgi:FkbM family methyltransferase